jgi:UDP-glucose 4-epimerase
MHMAELRRVLVTGGCGFIGANLVRFIARGPGWDVRVVDDLRAGREAYLDDTPAEIVVGDVSEDAVLDTALNGVDAVVHLASQTGVIPSVEDPHRDFEGNTRTTFKVLDGCRKRGIDRVVFASSGAALGDVPGPLHEEVTPRPLSPYGAGKLAGEAYCQAFAASFGMHAAALRFSNVYGPFCLHKNNAIPNFILRCLGNEPIEIFGDGSQTRDFIYVEDLCTAILAALETPEAKGQVFQLGTGMETSVTELAELVKKVTGSASEVAYRPKRAGEVYKSRTDISKARRLLSFEPRITLKEGLSRTARWMAHPS